jgi:hypothetical protein
MHTNSVGGFKAECPLIEEFHIKNIVGCVKRKQWIVGTRITKAQMTGSSSAQTYSHITGGQITTFDDDEASPWGWPAQILAQKIEDAAYGAGAPRNKTYVSAKTTHGFTLNGDESQFSVVIFGTAAMGRKPQGKWASDYCPYCKSQGFHGIIGSTLKDQVCFAFKHTLTGSGVNVISFATDTTPYKVLGLPRGLYNPPSFVTQMADNQYQIIITKTTVAGGAVVVIPQPSLVTPTGFTLTGTQNQQYDILILGSILY